MYGVTSKRQKWLFFLVGAFAAIGLFACLIRQREPSYRCKLLSEWLEIYGKEVGASRALRPPVGEGSYAIRQIGTNAIPFLLQWIRYDVSKDKFVSLARMLPPPLGHRCSIGQKQLRSQNAIYALAQLGDDAGIAFPELAKLMNDPERPNASRGAVGVLSLIGKPAVPILTAQLADTNKLNREWVLQYFRIMPELFTNSVSNVGLIICCLDDNDQRVSCNAARLLAQMGELSESQASLVVPALTKHLGPKSTPWLRAKSAEALGAYGYKANEAVPLLLALSTNGNKDVRLAANVALGKIAPEVLRSAESK